MRAIKHLNQNNLGNLFKTQTLGFTPDAGNQVIWDGALGILHLPQVTTVGTSFSQIKGSWN